jgi:molybdopterin synthase catalytic subunit
MDKLRIQQEDFDVTAELAALRAQDPRVGAVCCFVGTVRDMNDGHAVRTMELEHYAGMTEKSIASMVVQAKQRFDIYSSCVIHRVGLLSPMDQIVLVAVTSAHRGQSFQACEFLMDYLLRAHDGWMRVSKMTMHWRVGRRANTHCDRIRPEIGTIRFPI